jgi:hypothetical protein
MRHGQGEQTESVRVRDSHGVSVTADLEHNGTSKFSIEGKGPQGEEGNLAVCQTLVEAINRQTGNHWGPPLDVSQDQANGDVDCEAYHDGERLQIQVVRSETDESIWQTLKHQEQVQRDFRTVDEVTKRLYAAIQKKVTEKPIPPKQRPMLVLALRADITGLHAFGQVVTSFIRQYGAWTLDQGARI